CDDQRPFGTSPLSHAIKSASHLWSSAIGGSKKRKTPLEARRRPESSDDGPGVFPGAEQAHSAESFPFTPRLTRAATDGPHSLAEPETLDRGVSHSAARRSRRTPDNIPARLGPRHLLRLETSRAPPKSRATAKPPPFADVAAPASPGLAGAPSAPQDRK